MLDLTLMLYVENNITQVYILLNNDKKKEKLTIAFTNEKCRSPSMVHECTSDVNFDLNTPGSYKFKLF